MDITGLLIRQNCPNQSAYILVDQSTGERTVLWYRAGCLALRPEEIQPIDICAARLLHIDGCDVEAAAFAASVARSQNIPVSLDVDTVYPGFDSVLQDVDYLVASSNWPSQWTGKADPCEALKRLQAEYKLRVAAITLGENGSLAYEQGRWHYSPAFDVCCADTTGAGDVFHGAFCYCILSGMPMAEALEFSNAAAALNCTAPGARGHIANRVEVENLIKSSRTGEVGRRSNPEYVERFDLAERSLPNQ